MRQRVKREQTKQEAYHGRQERALGAVAANGHRVFAQIRGATAEGDATSKTEMDGERVRVRG